MTDCDASVVLAAIRSRTQEPRFARLRRQRGAIFEGRTGCDRLKLVHLHAREFRIEAWGPGPLETRVRVRFAPGRVLINLLLLVVAATAFHYLDALAGAGAIADGARFVPPAIAAAIIGIEYLTLRHVSRRIIGLIRRSVEEHLAGENAAAASAGIGCSASDSDGSPPGSSG